jgi:hypothetical protein
MGNKKSVTKKGVEEKRILILGTSDTGNNSLLNTDNK